MTHTNRISLLFHRENNTPFKRPQENSTITNYALIAAKLILFLARPKDTYQLELHEDLQSVVEVFVSELKEMHAQEQDLSTMDKTQITQLTDHVHNIFLGLWMHRWRETTDCKFPDPTVCYLAFGSLKKDGTFHPPKNITHTLAALCYVLRCTFKQQAIFRADPTDEDGVENSLKALKPWFTEKHHTTFNTMMSYQHYFTSVVYSTPQLPTSWWVDNEHHQVLCYKGHKIELKTLSKMARALQDEMANLWETGVCMGALLRVDYYDVADDLGNRNLGYSFLSDERNSFSQHRDMLLKAIMNHPELRDRFVIINNHRDEVEFTWNAPALHAWLRKLAELELLSVTAAELLTGGPPRGTEAEAMVFCNISTRQRNLFFLADYACMVRMYQKTTAITGMDRLIPSAFDAFHADLVVQTLAIARPFALIAASVCFQNNPKILHQYASQLFMGYGKTISTDDMTGCMKRLTAAHLGAAFGVRDYRQFSTSFRRKLLKEDMDFLEGESTMESLDAQQMGHSRSTDLMHYGRTTEAFVGSEDVLPGLLRVSVKWQDTLCIPHGE
jgi:hypothetical protein